MFFISYPSKKRGCLKNVPSTWSHRTPQKPKRCRNRTPVQKWGGWMRLSEGNDHSIQVMGLGQNLRSATQQQPSNFCTCLQWPSNVLPVLRFLYLGPCHLGVPIVTRSLVCPKQPLGMGIGMVRTQLQTERLCMADDRTPCNDTQLCVCISLSLFCSNITTLDGLHWCTLS